MSWFNVWDGLKNKTCRYLLQRYLGQFLEEGLNLEQLNVELYNGKATIKNVSLRVETLNELLEAQGWPVEFTGGHIGLLTVSVPWNALMTSDSSIEATDVLLCLRPVKRANDGTSMIESMWSSVSSSLQLAEECMRQEEDDEEDDSDTNKGQSNSFAGLEKFAETIDNVLNRIRARFRNITIKIEYPSLYTLKGVAFNIHLDELFYQNETGSENVTNQANTESNSPYDNINRIPTYAKHNVIINGVNVFTQENCFSDDLDHQFEGDKKNEFRDNRINHEEIPILKITGQQNIQIKVKQSEDITGPKICFDIEFGAICAIFSPRQIQLLVMFLDAFSQEESYSGKNKKLNITSSTSDAYNKFENTEPQMAAVHGKLNIWTSTDDITAVGGKQTASYSNVHHRNPGTYCDSMTTSINSSTITSASKYQRKPTNLDSCGEISNFTIKVAAFMGVVLHEDILVESYTSSQQCLWNERSLKELLNVSKSFFDNILKTSLETNIGNDDEVSKLFCKKNHIFLHLYPIVADGKQNRNKNILQINTTISATKVELCEILEEKISHLVLFNRKKKNSYDGQHQQVRPEFCMNISSTNTSQLSKKCTTYTEISLEDNCVEFDITIIDRLGALFDPSAYNCGNTYNTNEVTVNQASLNNSEFNINCNLLDINLRFPIVDLRPIHDCNRVPWWKQNIRQDYLLLRFTQFKLNFVKNCIKLTSSEIDIFYCEKGEVKNHLINTRLKQNNESAKEPLCEYPQIILDFNQCSNIGDTQGAKATPNLPFSSKRNCRQTANTYPKKDSEFTENILLPGETHEINEFCERTMASSKFKIKLNFPILDFIFESKQLYEIIYNRLNTDLFMWEPSSPYLTKSPFEKQICHSMLNMGGLMDSVYISAVTQNDPFDVEYGGAKSTSNFNKFNSNNESDDLNFDTDQSDNAVDEDDDGDNVPRLQGGVKLNKANKISHNCSVELKVGKISGSFFVPVRDNDKHILPEVSGKFLVNLKNLKVFIVSGYGDDLNLDFLCIQIRNVELYHCGIVPMNSSLKLDRNAVVEDFMQSTIYKVPSGLTKGINADDVDDKEMLSLVIEIKKNPLQKIKRLKITTGIKYTTLRYHPSTPAIYWINQLIDFIDVMDFPIEGYKPFSVISEMQLHLWECAIDYRPDDFSYRAVIELFYFSICSNIIPSMPNCNLRFVLEECVLSVAPYGKTTNKYPCYKVSFIDSKNLVPVLDIGVLDISLRLNEEVSEKCPIFDLRCSIHDVHFRTCYDSCSAFAQIIGHIAQDANNTPKHNTKGLHSQQSSISSETDLFLSQTELPVEITKKQQERVNSLMAEAVQESNDKTNTMANDEDEDFTQIKDELKLFYFPDENSVTNNKTSIIRENDNTVDSASSLMNQSCIVSSREFVDPLPLIKAEFGEINDTTNKAPFEENLKIPSYEDDYCIVVDEEISVMDTKYDLDNFRISDDPLMIVDNHFCLPLSSNDVLKTPANFPMPDRRYTLCEMTFTWHLYGGHDFSDSICLLGEPLPDKTLMSETYRHGVSYSNESSRLQHGKKPKEKITWKSVGGTNRNHEILVEMQFTKVRFSYEIYPLHTSYASRQVLLVNEIEIRDRLQSSEINKFLYNANLKSFTTKRSQHMVSVKALHVRPNPNQSSDQECSLRISLSPLRVHIDQDTLEFLTDFFTSFGKVCDPAESDKDELKQEKSLHKPQIPVMTINDENEIPESVHDLRARRIVSENISLLIDEKENESSVLNDNVITAHDDASSSSPIFFREIIFDPDVSICFDYHGRRVELSKGPIAGLLMGLGQLQCSEIILRKIVYRRGILGFEKVCNYLCKEWLRDIKRNQLPKILSGVGPTYAFVQLFQGIYDLFWLPIEHYQKDGRIIRGLQLGAQSFSARTILAALEITSRLIQLLQFTAETAFDMVSSGPSVRHSKKSKKGKKRQNRPRDIREGVANAYQILKEGINDSANNLIETAAAEHDQKGLTGAVGAVMRQVPQLVVCPAVLATQATTNILGGVKSSLVPEAKLEAKEKWKDENC